jgi:hypothetical protein
MLVDSRRRGALAELLCAYRFVEAGRLVSWPLIPCTYDLIVDGGDRLYRVQVKQAHQVQHEHGFGTWRVRLTKRNERGDKPVLLTDLDVLCVVTTVDAVFVIPVEACASPVDGRYLNARVQIGPESKYQLFRNRFAIGTALTAEVAPASVLPVRGVSLPGRMRRASGSRRKPHHRLSPAQVAQIRALPIRWYRAQPPEGLIELEDAARQFNVCPTTLRNLVLRASRQDLSLIDTDNSL